jgi:hypothetical protein
LDPHIVDKAPMPPGQCLFSQDIDGPWIDLGLVAPWVRPYGYLSVKYVEGLAKDLLDMVPQGEVSRLADRLEKQAEEIESLREILDAMESLNSLTKKERTLA